MQGIFFTNPKHQDYLPAPGASTAIVCLLIAFNAKAESYLYF
jgi:hypothetical protein